MLSKTVITTITITGILGLTGCGGPEKLDRDTWLECGKAVLEEYADEGIYFEDDDVAGIMRAVEPVCGDREDVASE